MSCRVVSAALVAVVVVVVAGVVVVVSERVGFDGQEVVWFVWLQVGPAGQDIEGTTEGSQVRKQPGKAKPPWSDAGQGQSQGAPGSSSRRRRRRRRSKEQQQNGRDWEKWAGRGLQSASSR